MGNIVVGIHQPNFMPWLGYFYKIRQSDIFIFLDDVQFQKTGASYTNRVSINVKGKASFATVPVKREEGTWKINETKFMNGRWKRKMIGTLQVNYAKAPFFKDYKEFIFDLINFEANNLADYNINFIEKIAEKLDLNTQFVKSSKFNIQTTSTQRLIDLIKNVNGNIYLSGSGGDNYQEHDLYEKENIKLIYNKMPKFEYSQLKTDNFLQGLSIIDAIFNLGFEDLQYKLFLDN
ncbi:hypothetical protein MNB_SV-3-342 [hydrothermal vent metagenome]|uniref:WbqC-like protein family n=1 Tax=hydrothermal vent metagenome TaxID=652676 RepID=A0A1W1CJR3_9ZZZZ